MNLTSRKKIGEFFSATIIRLTIRRRLHMYRTFAIVVLLSCTGAFAQTTKPSTVPALAADVQALLDQVRDAYASSKSLEFSGTISFHYEAGTDSRNLSAPFTASYRAPMRFRHEVKDDTL